MQDKLQVISMRTDPNRRSARMDKLVDLWDKWTIEGLIWFNGFAIGALICMKLIGG